MIRVEIRKEKERKEFKWENNEEKNNGKLIDRRNFFSLPAENLQSSLFISVQ